MAVWVGPERDSDGQPTTLHVAYAAGHHVSEAEVEWLRGLIAVRSRIERTVEDNRDILDRLKEGD